MMKKFSKIFICTFMATLLLCTLTACGNTTDNDKDIAVLQMDTRYIRSVTDKSIGYFIFHGHGIGEYHYQYRIEYISSDNEYQTDYVGYTVIFKYTFVDEEKSAVVCFYDSVEYDEKCSLKIENTWTRLVTVSKNVLCLADSGGYFYYINENYATENLPNYNK